MVVAWRGGPERPGVAAVAVVVIVGWLQRRYSGSSDMAGGSSGYSSPHVADSVARKVGKI